MAGKDDLRGRMAGGAGRVWSINSFLPEGAACVRRARVCAWLACPPGSRVRPARGGVSSWVPAAPGPVPTRAGAGRARVVHGLPDRGSLGGSVDNRSRGWGIKALEELAVWCQRRKEQRALGAEISQREGSGIQATGKTAALFSPYRAPGLSDGRRVRGRSRCSSVRAVPFGRPVPYGWRRGKEGIFIPASPESQPVPFGASSFP